MFREFQVVAYQDANAISITLPDNELLPAREPLLFCSVEMYLAICTDDRPECIAIKGCIVDLPGSFILFGKTHDEGNFVGFGYFSQADYILSPDGLCYL